MCKAIAEIRTEGRTEGALAKARETALNLHKMGMEPKKIAKVVNESTDLVKEWLTEPL